MATETMSGKVYVYLNGKRQALVESITFNLNKRIEEIQVLDSVWPLPREILDEGDGEITFIMGDLDDDYGPGVELLAHVIGYSSWDDTNDKWDVTNQDMTIDNAGLLKQYFYDRQYDDTGAPGTPIVEGAATETLTYMVRGDEIDRLALDLVAGSTASMNAGHIKVTGTASGDDCWINNVDLADGEKEYTLYTAGGGAVEGSITTHGGTMVPGASDTLTIAVDGAPGDTATLDVDIGDTNPWYQMREYTLNLMDLEIRVYEDTNTNYNRYRLDRVRFTKGGVDLSNDKAARGRVSFTFEDYTLTYV